MKLLTTALIAALFLLSSSIINSQNIQFKLNCNTSACGLTIHNLANDTLFKVNGYGYTQVRTSPSITGSYFAVNNGNNWIFDVGNYSSRNFVSFNGSLVGTHIITDSIGSATTGGDIRITQFLRITGSGCYTGTWNQCSDIKLKKNINRIDNALSKILNLQGVTYQWRKDEFPAYKFENGGKIGLIAQEVENVLPELVRTESDGMKSVNYSNLTAVLVEAMKEQQKIIEEQKRTIDKLEDKLEVLESRVDKIQQK